MDQSICDGGEIKATRPVGLIAAPQVQQIDHRVAHTELAIMRRQVHVQAHRFAQRVAIERDILNLPGNVRHGKRIGLIWRPLLGRRLPECTTIAGRLSGNEQQVFGCVPASLSFWRILVRRMYRKGRTTYNPAIRTIN